VLVGTLHASFVSKVALEFLARLNHSQSTTFPLVIYANQPTVAWLRLVSLFFELLDVLPQDVTSVFSFQRQSFLSTFSV
jgi:hypothetical protein